MLVQIPPSLSVLSSSQRIEGFIFALFSSAWWSGGSWSLRSKAASDSEVHSSIWVQGGEDALMSCSMSALYHEERWIVSTPTFGTVHKTSTKARNHRWKHQWQSFFRFFILTLVIKVIKLNKCLFHCSIFCLVVTSTLSKAKHKLRPPATIKKTFLTFSCYNCHFVLLWYTLHVV